MLLKNQAIQTALTGDWQSAISLNKSLLAENPQDIDALNRLALAFAITGNLKEAKKTYLKVLDIDPLNPIALRNIKRVKDKKFTSSSKKTTTLINNQFIEETGKTKVVELVNITQPKIIESLRTGEMVSLCIKRLKVFVLEEKQYVGVLPDDIGKRLIKLMKSGNKYDAFVKCASPHKVTIFIKEVKRSARYKDQPSFIHVTESNLNFDKNNKFKNMVSEKDNEEEEENYPLEEE